MGEKLRRRPQRFGASVQQTADGGYIATGTTSRDGESRIYLIKTDVDGHFVWERAIGSAANGSSVQQTADGGYIIAAAFVPSSGVAPSI